MATPFGYATSGSGTKDLQNCGGSRICDLLRRECIAPSLLQLKSSFGTCSLFRIPSLKSPPSKACFSECPRDGTKNGYAHKIATLPGNYSMLSPDLRPFKVRLLMKAKLLYETCCYSTGNAQALRRSYMIKMPLHESHVK